MIFGSLNKNVVVYFQYSKTLKQFIDKKNFEVVSDSKLYLVGTFEKNNQNLKSRKNQNLYAKTVLDKIDFVNWRNTKTNNYTYLYLFEPNI